MIKIWWLVLREILEEQTEATLISDHKWKLFSLLKIHWFLTLCIFEGGEEWGLSTKTHKSIFIWKILIKYWNKFDII